MTFISSLIVALINTLTTHALLTRKKSIPYCITAFIINTFVIVFAINLDEKFITNPTINKYLYFSIVFLYIIYIHIVFKESLSKKIFTMFSVWMLSTCTLFLVASVSTHFLGHTPDGMTLNLLYLSRIGIQVILLVLVYVRLSKPYKIALGLVTNKTIYFMSLYPIIAFLLLVNSFTSTFGLFRTFNSIYDMLLFLTFIFLGYLLVFAGISSSAKAISLQYNHKIIENQVELQRQNFRKLNESLETLYAVKHDTRHHILAIKMMIQEENYKQALEYIDQFNQNELSTVLPRLCENFTTDSIIKYYMGIAINKNIKFTPQLTIPEDININPLDLCVILGNSLENSIEACDKLSSDNGKYIELVAKCVGSHIIFNISNSFNGKIVKVNNTISSSKGENDPSHGIGLSSIRSTVNKYKGNLDINYTDERFEITIILNTGLSDL